MQQINSIRPFIGAKDYELSREFYRAWGFEEIEISNRMSYFHLGHFGFYLQDYFVKEWVDNSMVFLEVDNLETYWEELKAKNLDTQFQNVKLVDPQKYSWGSEGFVHDPSNILWHIGCFF
ncbi:MAG: hypothetical protein Tsb0034_00260 [Ekhidna sp.]